MYGYLRPNNSSLDYAARRSYRERYCSLCHALWNNYGALARMILSYDVTFATIILDLNSEVDFERDTLVCYKKNKIKENKEIWKILCATSILLAAGKLKDNILDENSFLAKALYGIYFKTIKKAEKDYPEISTLINKELAYLNSLEKENKDIETLAQGFGEMMLKIYNLVCTPTNETKAVVLHISKWVYFIDALDDLDKDIALGRFNPFKQVASSFNDLIENNFQVVEDFIIAQRQALLPYKDYLKEENKTKAIINNIVNSTIPEVTLRVLRRMPVFKRRSLHLRLVQAKGGIIFA